jgi:hypothetical protein
MTIFVSSCRNKLTKKYAKKNGTPCILMVYLFMIPLEVDPGSTHFQYRFFYILNYLK